MLFLPEILAYSGCDKYGRSNGGMALAGEEKPGCATLSTSPGLAWDQSQASAVERAGRVIFNVL
jgi:hypothetical protein